MKKQIVLKNQAIGYTLKKSRRARRMRLAVNCDGSVVLTLPQNLQETAGQGFIRQNTEWLFSKIRFFKKFKPALVPKLGRRDYLKHKVQAHKLAKEKLAYFNQFYGFKFGKICIKNQKNRWGSCSRKGNLNFNFKILFLPEKLRDYIIVHELCHLQEFNHSKRFWGLVVKTIAKWPELKKELKTSTLNL